MSGGERRRMRAIAFCAGPAALSAIAPPLPEPSLPPVAVWLALAKRALAAGDTTQALRCFESALAHEPRLAVAHLGRAACLAKLDRDEEAQDAIGATLEVAIGQEEVLFAMARMCAHGGQTAFAIPLLVEAIRAKPSLVRNARADPLFADHPAFTLQAQ